MKKTTKPINFKAMRKKVNTVVDEIDSSEKNFDPVPV